MKMALVILLVFILDYSNIYAYSESINVAWIPWCPWMCDSNVKSGFSVEVLENIFKHENIRIQLQKYSWPVAIHEVRLGRVMGILAPAKLEAPDFIFPTEPIAYQNMCFYVKANFNWVYKDFESLKNISIAIQQGANYPSLMNYIYKNIENEGKIYNISTEEPFPIGFKNLLNNRYHSFVIDQSTADYYLKNNNLDNNFKKAGCLESEYLYFALTPKFKEKSIRISKLFDKYMEIFKHTKEYQRLLKKYSIKNFDSNIKP
jgi:polar amino acid transport system substrate-binding protein